MTREPNTETREVYGEEPSGVYEVGRLYERRFWNQAWMRSETRTVVRDYAWTPARDYNGTSPVSRDTTTDRRPQRRTTDASVVRPRPASDVAERTVEAYVLRWDHAAPVETADGERLLGVVTRSAMDVAIAQWEQELEDGEAGSLPAYFNHARRTGDLGAEVRSAAAELAAHGHDVDVDEFASVVHQRVGWLVDAVTDERGMLGTFEFDDSPLGWTALEYVRSGVAAGFSVHLGESEARDAIGPSGRPLVEVVSARLVEAGPVDFPADPECRAVTIAGRPFAVNLGEAMAEIRAVTGLSDEAALRRRRLDAAVVDSHTARERREADEHRSRLVSAIKKLRRKAEVDYSEWVRTGRRRSDLYETALAADREARACETELDELVFHDRSLKLAMFAKAGVESYRSPFVGGRR